MTDLLATELAYVPAVIGDAPGTAPVLVCGGMGGSAFPARVLRLLGASPYVISHQDYGLPLRAPEGARYVAISYSGETEETLSFAEAAFAAGLPLSVVAGGGTLLRFAQEHGLPYVAVPTGPEPRDAVIVMTKALLALIGESHLFDVEGIAGDAATREGEALAGMLEGAIPVVYSSVRNEVLSSLAKALFNESAKVPAFANVFPELNHNEMQGFAATEGQPLLAESFVAVFLHDASDDARITRRMVLTEELLAGQGVRTARVELPGGMPAQSFVYGWWLMRTAARALAAGKGIDPDETALIAVFKERL